MRLAPQILAALEETGLPWDIDHGSKHPKIRVAGRLAAIVSYGGKLDAGGRNLRNTVAQIRRVAREVRS